MDRPFFPILGPSVIVDPSFAYYRDRSAESIAAEVRANGYSIVHCIADPSSHVNPKLVEAFHRAGIGVWLQVFGNGTYSKDSLPPEWPAWRMMTRTDLKGGTLPGTFQRLCLNNADYRAWKKRDLANALRVAPFDGIEICESHWPEYPGVESPAYGCFCDACKCAFIRMFPGDASGRASARLPLFPRKQSACTLQTRPEKKACRMHAPQMPDVPADSPRSPARNPELWAKWLKFRQASLTAFLNDVVNGPDGLRETTPGRSVAVWSLAWASKTLSSGCAMITARMPGKPQPRQARCVLPANALAGLVAGRSAAGLCA